MSNSQHWYDTDGKPCHVQPTKSKNAKSPFRSTTLADAKKLHLLPSVSGITNTLAAHGLVDWKLRKVAEACFRCPPIAGEELDGYIADMVAKSKDDAKGAADLGTAIHAALEAELTCVPWEDREIDGVPVSSYVNYAVKKLGRLGIQIEASEQVLVNRWDGYAGTTDVLFTQGDHVGVLDFKSKRTKVGEDVVPSETHPMQIAAYLAANWKKERDCPAIKPNMIGYNMYISTTEPGRVEVVQYGYKELCAAWEAFNACLTLWRFVHSYDPRQK